MYDETCLPYNCRSIPDTINSVDKSTKGQMLWMSM